MTDTEKLKGIKEAIEAIIFDDLSLPTAAANFILVEYQKTPDLPKLPELNKKRLQFKCDGTMKKRRFKR